MTNEQQPLASRISLGELTFVPDVSGALYAPEDHLLVIADLHFEKGSAFAKRGAMLPPYDTRETLRRLRMAVERLKPKTVIALGDTWHDGGGYGRMDAEDVEAFGLLRQDIDWVFISGNHDPEPPRDLGATVARELMIKGVSFCHEPSVQSHQPQISGHLHPAAKVRGRGRSVRRKCFVASGTRCILPAFGAYAGGLNVLDPAFAPYFAYGQFTTHLLGADRVYAVGPSSLLPD
jgi:hypothetical protein